MIDVLIQGRLHAAPQQRTSKAGKPFATAKLAALPPPVQYDTDKRRAARRTALEISRRIP